MLVWLVLAAALLALAGSTGDAAGDGDASVWQWRPWHDGLPTYGLAVAVAGCPSHPAVMYAATYEPPVLWRSDDAGHSWIPDDGGIGRVPVYALHWDALRQQWWAGAEDGLYVRSEGAAGWRPHRFSDHAVYDLVVGHEGEVYAALTGQVARSLDGGDTWELHGAGLVAADAVLDLAVSPVDPALVFAAAWDGLYCSRDAGRNWNRCSNGLGYPDVNALMWDREGNLIAGARSGLYRNEHGRGSWEEISDIGARAVLTFAGAEDGLFRWKPGAEAWQALSLPLTAPTVFVVASDATDGMPVYAGATDGLWRSSDGETWRRWGTGLDGITITSLAISPVDERFVFAGTRHRGLYSTADGGATWRPGWAGRLQSASVRDILFAADGRSVYVAADQGIWRGDVDGAQ